MRCPIRPSCRDLNNEELMYEAQSGFDKDFATSLNHYPDSLEALGKTKEAAAARARAKEIQDRIDRNSGK